MSELWTIGIDPGLGGAITVLAPDGRIDSMRKMPVFNISKTKRELDITALSMFFGTFDVDRAKVTVWIEKCQAMPGQGVVSMFNYGRTYGATVGVCMALGFPVNLVHPKTWKSKLTKDMPKGKGSHLLRVSQLYGLSLEKKEHDVADSILIATYGRNYG